MTRNIYVRLQDVIDRLVDEIRRYAERQHRPNRIAVPNPPATPEEIRALEETVGRRLPTSYRAFLQLHNGFRRLAYPGNMLKIEDMMPQSPIHAKVLEWKKMTTQYGGGEVLDGVVIADQTEPNHWIYLDPNKPTAPDEWLVVFHTPSDDSTYPDLVAYFESRIDEIRTIQHLMSDGELPG